MSGFSYLSIYKYHSTMTKYSLIPPEYKTNTNMLSTTCPVTPPRTQQTYNDATKSRALDHSPTNTSKFVSSPPLYWADPSPSPWELEVAMSVSKSKPKTKPKTKLYTSRFREVGLDDLTEPYTAGYRSEPEPDYHLEPEHKKAGKMVQVVKDISKRFHTTATKK